MAFIDNDEVEEIGRECFEEAGRAARPRQAPDRWRSTSRGSGRPRRTRSCTAHRRRPRRSRPSAGQPGCCGRRGRGCVGVGARLSGSSGPTTVSSRSERQPTVLPVPVAIVSNRRSLTLQDRFDRSVDRDLLVVAFVLADGVIERGEKPFGQSLSSRARSPADSAARSRLGSGSPRRELSHAR